MMKKNLRYVLLPLTLLFAILAINVLHAPSNTKQTPAAFPQFQTRDLAGHVVTNEVFAGKFTILVLWVVKDTNSRQLLQELTDWQVHESADIQIIGLIGDVKTTDNEDKIALTQTIVQDIPSPQLLVNDDMAAFLTTIKAAPTICFVNPYGQLIGQPVTGYEIDLIKKEARRLMATDSQSDIDKSLIMKKLSH